MEQYCYSRKSVPVQQRKPANQTFSIQDNREPGVAQRLAWDKTRPLNQQEGDHSLDRGLGFGRLKFCHRHIIFDAAQNLPAPVGNSDNIGFGSHGLFRENHAQYGYTDRGQITNNAVEDAALIVAINAHAAPGPYNLFFNNCQDWVYRVRRTVGL